MSIVVIIFTATIALVVVLLINDSPASSDGCTVSINEDLGDPQPLILRGKGPSLGFVDPVDTTGTLSFSTDEEFRLVCPGEDNYLVNIGDNTVQDISAYCVNNKTFLVDSVEHEFPELVCSSLPSTVARVTGDTCLDNYTQVDIGFEVSENELLRTLEICRDDETLITYYSKFNLTKAIGGYQSGYPRPKWTHGDFHSPYNLDTQYSRSVQIATVSECLNSTELGAQYISTTSDYYLSRGHLTAKADFVYGIAHHSTFWYLNSAPQWQPCNGGNWNDLEQDVRRYASTKQLDLEVYTGVHGVALLPDVNNEEQPLFLYASGDERALPVPKFFWKIIYDPLTRRGTAFVSINNPYINKLTADYLICNDISSEISWLSWKADKAELGLSYACSVDDLAQIVTTLPRLVVSDILT